MEGFPITWRPIAKLLNGINMTDVHGRNVKVLAVASAGGHWVQLFRMRPAWDNCTTTYVTTSVGYKEEILEDAELRNQKQPGFHTVVDANMDKKFRLLVQLLQILLILLRERPDVILSTGAAPGFFALKIGKILGSRTIWIDSIANAETMSLSGEKAGSCSDLWLTQWEHLSSADGPAKKPDFKGSVV